MLNVLYTKFIAIIIGVLSVIAAIWSYTYKVRANERRKLEHGMYMRTLERVEHAKRIEDNINTESDDILDKLRENGWLRK